MNCSTYAALFTAGADWGAIITLACLIALFSWWNSASTKNSGPPTSSEVPGDFEIRLQEVWRGKDKDIKVVAIEARGKLTVNAPVIVQFVCAAEDFTDKSEGEPILCTLDAYKAPKSYKYMSKHDFGLVKPNQYLVDWHEVGWLILDHAVAPKSGRRNLKFYCAMTAEGDLETTFEANEASGTFELTHIGYNELDEKRMEAISLSLDLGVAIAYGDGNLDRSEGQAISDWLRNKLEMFDDETKPKARAELNAALKTSFDKAATGKLTVKESLAKLKASKVRNAVSDALELSSIVMAADGVIAESEMAMLRSFAKELGVNLEDLQNIADKHVAGAKATKTDKTEVSDESLIGIDPKADKAVIKRALIEAFGKYNARLQTEKEPARRTYYQDMLNAVARLRKKYA
jgi:tellurite resistance protein